MSAPRYTLIQGDFYILYPDLPRQGPEPDGDTVTFLPDQDDLVRRLRRFSGTWPDRKHLGTYSVRFESIDALETHFAGHHQQLGLAQAARDLMLQRLGFGRVEFDPARPNKVASAEHHPVRGYLLANGIESNGRVLGLVYAGDPPPGEADGQRVFVAADRLDDSVNAALVAAGLAYVEVYHTMPLALIRRMRELVGSARAQGAGLWPKESVTLTTAVAPHAADDLDDFVIFPKLYRRLVSFFTETGLTDLTTFDSWVRADPVHRDDRALLLSGEVGNLHDLYEVTGCGADAAVQLRGFPEDMIFDPDPAA
ncbi:MAG TPA: thermonuclease family protein [Kineosporiaceae bacterium]